MGVIIDQNLKLIDYLNRNESIFCIYDVPPSRRLAGRQLWSHYTWHVEPIIQCIVLIHICTAFDVQQNIFRLQKRLLKIKVFPKYDKWKNYLSDTNYRRLMNSSQTSFLNSPSRGCVTIIQSTCLMTMFNKFPIKAFLRSSTAQLGFFF